MPRYIDVVAALLSDADGRALMVRKRGTRPFMQPGGKPEPGEDLLDALRRELREELGLDLPPERFSALGEFESPAANEPGFVVRAAVWALRLADEDPRTGAEIDELAWVDPHAPHVPLAPLSEHELLPVLREGRTVIPEGHRLAVEPETVAALVEDQLPDLAGLPVRPVAESGWDNLTFRLGDRLSVRLPSALPYRTQPRKETTWVPRISAHVPFDVPTPVALGAPGHGYPFAWSVWEWIEGRTLASSADVDPVRLAADVAEFLRGIREVPTQGAPLAGPDNFFRGGDLAVYDAEAREALVRLEDQVDAVPLLEAWDAALASRWQHDPVWVHGDVAPGNLLLDATGRLRAVIDFGSSGVGDPACDLVLAWTVLDGPARRTLRAEAGLDDATWQRARGWALWKAAITDDLAVLRTVLED